MTSTHEAIPPSTAPHRPKALGRFAARFAAFVIWIGVVGWALAALPPSKREVPYLSAWQDKKARLWTTDQPKVVLVGGSNVAFGLSGRTISKHVDRPVVNLGLHFGLGLTPVLREVCETLKPNDVVIVSPEYEFFLASSGSGSVVPTMRMHVDETFGKPSISERLSETPIRTVLAFRNAGDLLQTALNDTLGRSSSGLESQIFTRDAFNEFGDMVAHRGRPSLGPVALSRLHQWELDDAVIREIVRFRSDAESVGASVVMIPPPLDRESFSNRRPLIEAVDRRLADAGVGFAWSPRDSVVESSEVFDAPYHLIGTANDRRSIRLAEWITKGGVSD